MRESNTQENEVNRTSIRRAAVPFAALALGLSLSACGAGNEDTSSGDSGSGSSSGDASSSVSGTLNGAGSSAQEAAQGAWTAGFQEANPDATVNYDPSGSGAGVEQFLAGAVNFAGSDAYLDDTQLADSKKACGDTAIEVPAYISPIALIFNVDGVDQLNLSPETVAGIFSGKITTWDDSAIQSENPDAKLPSDRITAVHRSDDSGTTKNFTDWLSQTAGDAWGQEAAETWPFKSGEAAEGTSGVVEAVTNGKGTIGYADASQAGDLGKASIKVGSEYVGPTADAAAKAAEVSKPVSGRADNDMALDVDRTTTESGA